MTAAQREAVAARRATVISHDPTCDFCEGGTPARYEGKTQRGPWAYMCGRHYMAYGVGLGPCVGQELIRDEVQEKPKPGDVTCPNSAISHWTRPQARRG